MPPSTDAPDSRLAPVLEDLSGLLEVVLLDAPELAELRIPIALAVTTTLPTAMASPMIPRATNMEISAVFVAQPFATNCVFARRAVVAESIDERHAGAAPADLPVECLPKQRVETVAVAKPDKGSRRVRSRGTAWSSVAAAPPYGNVTSQPRGSA
jgi:hypothetical protein